MKKSGLLQLKYSPPEIIQKRAAVGRYTLQNSPTITGTEITRISGQDLELLFQLYDHHFLQGYFSRQFAGTVRFSLSSRMTRSAGKTHFPKNLGQLKPHQEEYEIRIGVAFLFNFGQLAREKTVNGIQAANALEALQLVFEHEICHLVELHCCRESSCRRERFKTIAFSLFGHNDSYHHLPTEREIAAVQYGFVPGMSVRFRHQGALLSGFIHRINKRATVMVPDKQGEYQDQAGTRYAKWYVPLDELETVSDSGKT